MTMRCHTVLPCMKNIAVCTSVVLYKCTNVGKIVSAKQCLAMTLERLDSWPQGFTELFQWLVLQRFWLEAFGFWRFTRAFVGLYIAKFKSPHNPSLETEWDWSRLDSLTERGGHLADNRGTNSFRLHIFRRGQISLNLFRIICIDLLSYCCSFDDYFLLRVTDLESPYVDISGKNNYQNKSNIEEMANQINQNDFPDADSTNLYIPIKNDERSRAI